MRRPVGSPRSPRVAGLEQSGSHDADLDHFAADAVDLDPVADANAALAHEDKPTEEGENKVLQGDGEGSGGETENGGRFMRRAEEDKQNQQCTDHLYGQFENHAQGLRLPSIEYRMGHQAPYEGVAQNHADENENDECGRLKNEVQKDAMLAEQLRRPLGVNGGELLLGLNAVVVDTE